MPTVFLNSTVSGDMAGWSFTTMTQLIDQIRTTLNSAGWTTIGSPTSTFCRLRGTFTGAGNCWFTFTVNGSNLEVRADLDGTGATLSGAYILTMTASQTNRLWIAADENAACLAVRTPANAWTSLHLGYLDLYKTDDTFGWGINGFPDAPVNFTIARHWISSSNMVRYDNGVNGGGGWSTPDNVGRINIQGPVNDISRLRGSKAQIGPYYYLERDNSGNRVVFRGYVKFAVTGLGSLAAGTVVTGTNGFRYLSTCLDGSNWDDQGFRIA